MMSMSPKSTLATITNTTATTTANTTIYMTTTAAVATTTITSITTTVANITTTVTNITTTVNVSTTTISNVISDTYDSTTSFTNGITSMTSSTTSTVTTPTNSTTNAPFTTTATIIPDTSSGSANAGPIVAVVIVIILLIAIVVTVVIIIFLWRKNKKNYESLNTGSKKPPLSVTGLSISEHDHKNITATPNNYQKPLKDDLELQNRSPDHKMENSEEASVKSQEQSPSLINPEHEKSKITEPDNVYQPPESTVANPRFSIESSGNPVFTESINPTAFITGKVCASNDTPSPFTSIYADPVPLVKSKGPPVVTMDNIKQISALGTGLFGEVILANTVGLSYQYLGIGNSNDSTISMKVAVKFLKATATTDVKKAFDKEIKFMSRLKDDNVIRLLGICTTGTPFIMMEYMENGDLTSYLQQLKFTTDTEKLPSANEITLNALVYMSYQIASGMKYLSSCKFIHRDLAARNILVGINYTVKIADFGMSQNLYSAYYCRVGGRSVLPIRWMAYECYFGKFSVKTDVWAFGITLWEIFTLCQHLPFKDFNNQQMVEDAIKGASRKIPDQPENCPDDIYCIIKSCLRHEPSKRADFSELCDQLNDYYTNIL